MDRNGYEEEDLTENFPESYEIGRACICEDAELDQTDCPVC